MQALAASCEELRARTGNPPLATKHGRVIFRVILTNVSKGCCPLIHVVANQYLYVRSNVLGVYFTLAAITLSAMVAAIV